MSAVFCLALALAFSIWLRRPMASSLLAAGLFCLTAAYGLWASFMGAIFGLPVFLAGMVVLLATAAGCALTATLVQRTLVFRDFLRRFVRLLSGTLLVYSLVPLTYLIWFVSRLPDHVQLPPPLQTGLLVVLPLALPAASLVGWRLGERAA